MCMQHALSHCAVFIFFIQVTQSNSWYVWPIADFFHPVYADLNWQNAENYWLHKSWSVDEWTPYQSLFFSLTLNTHSSHRCQPLLGVNLSPEFVNLYFPYVGWALLFFSLVAVAFWIPPGTRGCGKLYGLTGMSSWSTSILTFKSFSTSSDKEEDEANVEGEKEDADDADDEDDDDGNFIRSLQFRRGDIWRRNHTCKNEHLDAAHSLWQNTVIWILV